MNDTQNNMSEACIELAAVYKRHGLIGHFVVADGLGNSALGASLDADWCAADITLDEKGVHRCFVDTKRKPDDVRTTLRALLALAPRAVEMGRLCMAIADSIRDKVGIDCTRTGSTVFRVQ